MLDAVESGDFDSGDIKGRMTKYKEREGLLITENLNIKSRIKKIPTTKDITRRAALMKRMLTQIAYLPSHLKKMTFDKKKAFLQTVFMMSNANEERPGIYLKKTDNKEQPWFYEIRGTLNIANNVGRLPMSESEKKSLFKWYYEDEFAENRDLFKDELKNECSGLWVTGSTFRRCCQSC